MATQKMVKAKLFNMEEWAGGGGYFPAGIYKLDSARYVMFDYMGALPEGAPTLAIKYQPLDRNYKDEGDAKIQHYDIRIQAPDADTDEWKRLSSLVAPSKDGKSLNIPDGCRLSKKCDTFLLIDSLAKSGFDMDQLEDSDDVSVIDGLVAEMGMTDSTRPPKDTPKARRDKDGKLLPNQTPVVKSLPANTKAAAGKTNGKAATAGSKKEEEESEEADPEAILQEFLLDQVLLEDNRTGIDKLKVRMAISGYVQKEKKGDADLIAKVNKVFNTDALETMLSSAGWALETRKGKVFIHQSE